MFFPNSIRLLVLGGASMACASAALADVKAGVDAWTRGDFAAAVNEWKAPADKGDADAQFNLGQAYKLGRGVPRDLAKAEALFTQASDHGHMQASDNLGLLLFQRGERERAMPFIRAASDRGEPRAQYLLGLAHFNGDNVPKDWVRAYALVSLSQQAGLAQARSALAQMDQYIPLEQRQQSILLASELSAQATANRSRLASAADLGASLPPGLTNPSVAPAPAPDSAIAVATRTAAQDSARTAGADFARPAVATASPRPAPTPPKPAAPKPPVAQATPAPTPPAPPPALTQASPSGVWRIQLGAFGVPANAEALWNRVKARPEVAGHPRLLVPAGSVKKLQASGYASEADARAACSRLVAAGFVCVPTRN